MAVVKRNLLKPASLFLLAALLVLLPLYLRSQFYLHIIIYIFVLIILALGVRLIYTTGMVSFAHAAFYAIGAYTSAVLVLKLDWSFWLTFLIGGILAAIVALIIGIPVLRIKGVYFFLVSFAFGMVVMTFIANYYVGLFGGPQGVVGLPPPNPITIPGLPTIEFVGKVPFYYLSLIMMAITVLIMYRLDKSRFGLICKSVRDADALAETTGINIMRYKVLAFVIACFFAGIAGAFIAHYYLSSSPGMFSFHLSVSLLVFMLVGGPGSVAGPMVGVAALVFLSEVFRDLAEALALPPGPSEVLIYGVILIVFIMFLPEGLIGLPRRVIGLFKRLRRVLPEKFPLGSRPTG